MKMAQEIWKKIPWIRQTETRADYCHEKTSCLFIYFKRFFRCGIAGWCLEILFTSVEAWMRGDVKMMGTTSVIMFPIYAAGAILPDIVKWCDRWLSGLPDFLKADREEISPVALKLRHGLIYMVLIYTGEYIAGSFLMAKGLCPWDYSQWPDQIHGVIRLAFIPFWFGTGLLFESLCTH